MKPMLRSFQLACNSLVPILTSIHDLIDEQKIELWKILHERHKTLLEALIGKKQQKCIKQSNKVELNKMAHLKSLVD